MKLKLLPNFIVNPLNPPSLMRILEPDPRTNNGILLGMNFINVCNVFLLLIEKGQLPETWLEKKIISLDKYDGDIEKLSRRLSYIRTWNYVANRGNWLVNPSSLQESAKSIEEKLSDKLHQLLIERFIDKNTTVLLKTISL